MKELEKNIVVCRFILKQLKRCLALYFDKDMTEELKATLRDIKTVEAELQKSMIALDKAKEAEKEQA